MLDVVGQRLWADASPIRQTALKEMTSGDYRELTEYEMAILLRLLTETDLLTPTSWEEMRICQVREIREYRDDYGSVEFHPSCSLAVAPSKMIVEAMSQDRDGVPFEAILHAKEHFVTELEFVKADGSPLIERPHPETFAVSEVHTG